MRVFVMLAGIVFAVVFSRPESILRHSDTHNQWYAAGTLLSEGRMMTPCVAPNGNQALHEALIGKCGDPMTAWPPLYTLVMAAARGVMPDETGAVLLVYLYHVATWAGVALLAHLLLEKALGRLAVLPAMLALFNPASIAAAEVVASEPQFLLLSLLFLYLAVHYRPTQRWLLLLIGVTILASLQRYTGVICIPLGIGFLLHQRKPRAALLFALATPVPLALWAMRNINAIGAPFGYRPPPMVAPAETLLAAVGVVTGWLPYLALCLLVGIVSRQRREPRLFTYAGVFGLTYFLLMLASANIGAFTLLNDRLLAPAFPPLVVGVAVVVGRSLG